jgi:HlyD family secretion protein
MNRKLLLTLTLLALLIILAGGMMACSAEETPEPTPVVPIQQPNTVSAEAFVVPIRQANLSLEIGGRLDHLYVEEGQPVNQGDLLLELSNASQQASLARAQAGLANAEATLADVEAGATPQEISQAQAALAKTEAALAQLLAGPTQEEIAQAQAAVASAQAGLNQVTAGPRQEQLDAAAARLMQTEADLRLAQADYDKFIYGEPDVAEPYGVALQKATLAYEAAQADYDALANGPTPQEVAVARAGVAEAQAALNKALAGATPEQVAQTQADVANAEAALARLEAGATPAQLAIAQAGVQAAQADVLAAQAELDKSRLAAPFAGVVGAVKVEEGEMVGAGTSVLSLGDTGQWQVETDDLTEIDVVRVAVGQPVEISVDALPEESYRGQVVRIQPQSETKAGDVTYTVLIDLTDGDTGKLRWGMTTFVDIETEPSLVQK